jgi:hypothetical protein
MSSSLCLSRPAGGGREAGSVGARSVLVQVLIASRQPDSARHSTHRPWCTCGTPRSRAPRCCPCRTAAQQQERLVSVRAARGARRRPRLTSLKMSRDARRLMLNIKANVSNSWRETALLPSTSISSKHVREWYQRNCLARSSWAQAHGPQRKARNARQQRTTAERRIEAALTLIAIRMHAIR